MAVINIVMGVTGSGRTHFINEHFSGFRHFSIGDYQSRLRKAAGSQDRMDFFEYKQLLITANEQIKDDVIAALKEGCNIALEHTLYKAKRRIGYIEAFKSVTDVEINIYVIMPSDEQFKSNLQNSHKHNISDFETLKKEMGDIEIPNIAEGYEKIFIVRDGDIEEVNCGADDNIIRCAKLELAAEAAAEQEREKKAKEHKEFMQSLNEKGFWHYCEVCGKKEFLTPEQAFNNGWDYPPRMGAFGMISPRTCGECSITDTVWWKLAVDKESDMENLTDKDKAVVKRILAEPYSLLEEKE